MPHRLEMFTEYRNGDMVRPYQYEVEVSEQAERYFNIMQELAEKTAGDGVTCRIYWVEFGDGPGDQMEEIDAKGVEIYYEDGLIYNVPMQERYHEYS